MARAKRKHTITSTDPPADDGPPASLTVPLPPEWLLHLPKLREQMKAAEAQARAAAEASANLDRVLKIQMGLIAPPWAIEAQPAAAGKLAKPGTQLARAIEILRELYPPNGQPPAYMKTKEVWRHACDQLKARGEKLISYDTVRIARRKLGGR